MSDSALTKLAQNAKLLSKAIAEEDPQVVAHLETLHTIHGIIEFMHKNPVSRAAGFVVNLPFALVGIDVAKKLEHFWNGLFLSVGTVFVFTVGGVAYVVDKEEARKIMGEAVDMGAYSFDEFMKSSLLEK